MTKRGRIERLRATVLVIVLACLLWAIVVQFVDPVSTPGIIAGCLLIAAILPAFDFVRRLLARRPE